MLGHNMMDNTNVEIVPDEGGLWVAQSRGAGNNASNCPSFVYIDNDGNQLFNSGSIADYLNGTNGSALAISKDRKTLVVVDADSNLAVFSVTWNDKTPSLKYEYTVKTGGTITNQIQYDYAGNLYVLNQKCLQVWALPTDNNNVTTPAEGTITIAHDGVENVFTRTRQPMLSTLRLLRLSKASQCSTSQEQWSTPAAMSTATTPLST